MRPLVVVDLLVGVEDVFRSLDLVISEDEVSAVEPLEEGHLDVVLLGLVNSLLHQVVLSGVVMASAAFMAVEFGSIFSSQRHDGTFAGLLWSSASSTEELDVLSFSLWSEESDDESLHLHGVVDASASDYADDEDDSF